MSPTIQQDGSTSSQPKSVNSVPATSLTYVINYVSKDIQVITVNIEHILTLINVYASPIEDFDPILSKLQDLYNVLSSNEFIFVGDFSPVWGGQKEYRLGEQLIEF